MVTGITNWGDAVMTSLAGAMTMFLAAIPKIIGFLVIIILGWIIAGIIAKAVAALLRTVHFNDLAQRSGFADFVGSMGVKLMLQDFSRWWRSGLSAWWCWSLRLMRWGFPLCRTFCGSFCSGYQTWWSDSWCW